MARKSKLLYRVIGLLVLGASLSIFNPQSASADWAPENDIALVNAKCPAIQTSVVETTYPYGIVVHHTVGNGGGDWFQAALGGHCGEDRPPYLVVIDKDGVAHQTAEFGSRTNQSRCNQYGKVGQCANTDYVSVAIVGDFRTDQLSDQQKETLKNVFRWFVKKGAAKIVLGHRDVGKLNGYTTECPGDNIYDYLPELTAQAFNNPTFSTGPIVTVPSTGISLNFLPCIVILLFGGVVFMWVSRDPHKNTKKLLRGLAKIQDWRIRRKMLRDLRKAQEKHGLIRVGLPAVLAIALIASGFQLKTVGQRSSSCSFVPLLSDHSDGSWDFGVHTDFQEYHTGVDKMGTLNEPIPASASGKVVWADSWPGDPMWQQLNIGHGNTVVVETSCNGVSWYHYYAHLNEIQVKVGQIVKQGEILGLMGQTGAAKGVHLHFAISPKGPTEEHSFVDWVNPNDFVKAHSGQSTDVDLWTWIKPFALGISGWSLIVLAVLVIIFFGESRGLFALFRRSLLPGFFFAALVLFGQLAPILSVVKFDWTNLAKNQWQKIMAPALAATPLTLPAPEFMAGASVEPGMQDIPVAFAEEVKALGPQVQKIAQEENVPASTIFTLWLKESGGRRRNPANGEGLCGFYSRVKGGRGYFTPGPIDDAEILRQLRECAKEFHVHNRTGTPVTYQTSDFDVLGPIYMAYNGNIDCHGGSFASWRDHPYVMNGYDSTHQHMVARDGQGGCVPLSIIGAVPADLRIRNLLAGK